MMEKRRINEELRGEFLEFIKAEAIAPPMAVSEEIHKAVAKDMTPPIWKVLFKFGLIQFAVSFMTLLVCPQFEVDLGIVKHDDAHLRALLGEMGYMTLCGAIFLGSGAMLASLLLRVEELRALKNSEYLYLFLASSIALMFFWQLGTTTIPVFYAAWFGGAVGGSITSFEIIKRLRLAGLGIGPAPAV